MKPVPAIAFGLSLALSTTACGVSAMQTQARPSMHVDVKDNQPPRPQIKRNPQPTAYEITMTIEHAPGPFGSVKAAMQYEVLNEQCLPDLGGMAGTRASLLEWVPVELVHVSGNTYRGTIHDGLLVDEDYYGLGICHWSLVTAQFKLTAGKSNDDSVFSYHLFHKDLIGKNEITVYFPSGGYPQASMPKLTIPGEESIERYRPEARDDLFTARLSIRKIAP